MVIARAFPILGRRTPKDNLNQLQLSTKAQQLRDKVRLLRATTQVPQELLHQIDSHLNAIAQERTLTRQWSCYELAYEEYISAARPEEVLGILLNLRMSAHILDTPGRELWSEKKLGQLEQEVRQVSVAATTREEVASLARAIYKSSLNHKRVVELKRNVVQIVFALNIVFAISAIALLLIFQTKQIAANSPWQIVLIGCFGASGALLSAALRLRQLPFSHENLEDERVGIFFRASVGAIAAVIVTLLLQLRIVDFPFLHTASADTSPFAPGALYIFAFLSGSAERLFFRPLEQAFRKGKESAVLAPGNATAPALLAAKDQSVARVT